MIVTHSLAFTLLLENTVDCDTTCLMTKSDILVDLQLYSY